MKAGVAAEGNPIKDGNIGMVGGERGNILNHPQGHLISDEVALFGHFLVVT